MFRSLQRIFKDLKITPEWKISTLWKNIFSETRSIFSSSLSKFAQRKFFRRCLDGRRFHFTCASTWMRCMSLFHAKYVQNRNKHLWKKEHYDSWNQIATHCHIISIYTKQLKLKCNEIKSTEHQASPKTWWVRSHEITMEIIKIDLIFLIECANVLCQLTVALDTTFTSSLTSNELYAEF